MHILGFVDKSMRRMRMACYGVSIVPMKQYVCSENQYCNTVATLIVIVVVRNYRISLNMCGHVSEAGGLF